MNDLIMYLLVFLYSLLYVGLFLLLLVKFWFRLERYPVIGKYIEINDRHDFGCLFISLLFSGFLGLFFVVAYHRGSLDTAFFTIVLLVLAFFTPRIAIDNYKRFMSKNKQ